MAIRPIDLARIVEAHQLVDGILHAQFINTDDGAYIIELKQVAQISTRS